jgi:adenosine kinase
MDGLATLAGTYTAQAFIITDHDDNQITAFHPGAMMRSDVNHVGDVRGVALGIVSPDGRDGMRQHAAEFRAAGIPYLFDPGQGMPLFSGEELVEMIDGARAVTVNDYEAELLSARTGLSAEAIAKRVDAYIVTLGAEGSRIHTGGRTIHVPAVPPASLVDPTGCGDAYRAGLLYGIAQRWDWEKSGRLASVLGSLKIAARGGQNHRVNRDAVAAVFSDRFGSPPW